MTKPLLKTYYDFLMHQFKKRHVFLNMKTRRKYLFSKTVDKQGMGIRQRELYMYRRCTLSSSSSGCRQRDVFTSSRDNVRFCASLLGRRKNGKFCVAVGDQSSTLIGEGCCSGVTARENFCADAPQRRKPAV